MLLYLTSPRENASVVTYVDKMAESKTCDVLTPTLQVDLKKKDSFPKRTNAFVIDWGEPKESSLQDAFLKFQKERQRDVRQTRKMRKKRKLKRDPARLNALRVKFIQHAKKYFGLPYARKYWPKDSQEYNSPMFLDCCGLVRQVVRDMRKDLGFRIGPWNQAYMYDTLPITLTESQMKPGDLVFMSGMYTNSKSKKQRHNMTHVEIWLGEGQKTIGARWNNGKVQIFDSYRFQAKSFHSEQYYFKSIDTWLMGICKSYCPTHPWRRSKYNPGKKSIFNPTVSQSQQNEPDEAASGDEADLDTPSSGDPDLDQDHLPFRTKDSSQSLDMESVKSDSSPELQGLAAVVPEISELDAPETPSSCDVSTSIHSYLSSGSESDDDEEIYDRQTWDTCSRLDYQNASPAFAISYLADSDDDLDMSINCIHSSKSSGCLSLRPPKPHPTLSSSSLPELDFDDNVSVDGPAVEAKTAWQEEESDCFAMVSDDAMVCSPSYGENDPEITQESPNLLFKDADFSDNQDPTNETAITLQPDSMSSVDVDSACFYCIAECNSKTCDFAAELYEPDISSDLLDYPEVDDLDDLDAFDLYGTYVTGPCDATELSTELKSGAQTPEAYACDKDNRNVHRELSDSQIQLRRTSSDVIVPTSHSESSPGSNGFQLTVASNSYPELTDLAVGDNDAWLTAPSDADTKQTSESSGNTDNSTNQTGNSNLNPSGGDSGGGRRDGGRSPGKGGGRKTPGGKPTKLPTCSLANNMTPSFYIGGGNGVALVEAPLLALGWKRTSDKYDERYRLKWVECKSRINYSAFREGDQLVNHIANCQLLTNKMGLLNSLQEYERVTLSTKGRLPRLKMAEFVPETYRLDNREDRETFLDVYKENEIWISKPTGMNQGKGIFLLRSKEEIDKLLSEREAKQQQSKPSRPLMSRIVQRYIHNPLLLDERKFDIRAYMLVASTVPYLVLYHKGYIRLSCQKYDGEDTNLTTHLTNQFIQKKVPNYGDVKEDTAWSMDKFNDYINEKVAPETGVEQNWAYNSLTKQMQRIMLHCFNSVKHKLQCKVGFFDLYGLDFMVDQDMKIWLIEINTNPCLATNCSALKEVIPDMVQEAVYLSLECFEKSRKNQSLTPFNSLKKFCVLYSGSNPNAMAPRQTRSVSPAKDNNPDKNKSTQSPTLQRRGRSPVRPIPRVAITTTSVTQSPYQTRKSEFQSLLSPHGASGNNKPANSARGSLVHGTNTSTTTVKSSSSAGSAQTGNSGTDKTLSANSANKNNNSTGAAGTSSDSKTSASNTKTSSESTKPRQGSGGATANKNNNASKVTQPSKISNPDKSSASKVNASSNGDKASATSNGGKAGTSSNGEKASPSGNGVKAGTSNNVEKASATSNGGKAGTSSNGGKASATSKGGKAGTSSNGDKASATSNGGKAGTSSNGGKASPSGNGGKAGTSSNGGKASPSGNGGKAGTSSNGGKASPSGNGGKAGTSSNGEKASATSNGGKAGTSSNGEKASPSGNGGKAGTSSNGEKASASSKNANGNKSSNGQKTTGSGKDSTIVSTSSKSDSKEKSPTKTGSSAGKTTSESQSAAGNSPKAKPESKSTEPISKQDSKPQEGKAEITTDTSSQNQSGEDIKLKMTHATGSANRKNRPRADTGN